MTARPAGLPRGPRAAAPFGLPHSRALGGGLFDGRYMIGNAPGTQTVPHAAFSPWTYLDITGAQYGETDWFVSPDYIQAPVKGLYLMEMDWATDSPGATLYEGICFFENSGSAHFGQSTYRYETRYNRNWSLDQQNVLEAGTKIRCAIYQATGANRTVGAQSYFGLYLLREVD